MAYAGVVGETELTSLEGFYKRIYGDSLERAVPINTKLQRRVGFREDESDGENFNQPVFLKLAHGISFAATNAGAFLLNAVKPIQTRNAQITGSQHLLRHALSYEAAAKAAKAERAFRRATAQQMTDMKESISKFLEIDLMYGQSGLATVLSKSGNVLTITPADWASGIWSGMDEMTIQVYENSSGVPGATPRAAATAIAAGGVDLDSKKITINDATNVTGGDHIVFGSTNSTQWNGSAWSTMVGLHKIATHSAGTLFNIDTSAHSLWKANSHDVGSTDLSFGAIQKACAKSMARGADGPVWCMTSPLTWANLMTDQAALRRYGAERRTLENGAEAIRFYSQTGSIDIEASIYCKEGNGYLTQPSKMKRLGATDVTFDMGKFGLPGGPVFRHMESNAGIEYRCYSHQCLFSSRIGSITHLKNILNS